MPVQIPPKALQTTTLYGFSGVDLRQDELVTRPNTLLEALDFDLHLAEGVATTRRPSRPVADLTNAVVNIQRAGNALYAVTEEGTVWRDWVSIGGNFGRRVSIAEYVRLNDDSPTVYLAGRRQMRRVVGGKIVAWGLERPTLPPVLSSTSPIGGLSGSFQVVYTYAVKRGNTLVLESNPSLVAKLAITAAETLNVTVTAPSDPQATHIRIYRSQAGSFVHLFEKELSNNGASQTVELTTPGNDLGAIVNEDNDPPIVTDNFVIHDDRAWLADSTTLYYSKKYEPESFPQLNFIPVGNTADPIIGLISSRYGLGVFTRRRRFRVLESVEGVSAIGDALPFFGGSASSFIPIPSPSERGGISPDGIIDADEGVIYAADDGIYVTDFATLDTRVSEQIGGLFTGRGTDNIGTVDRGSRSNTVLGLHGSKRYVSYTEHGELENSMTAIFSAVTKQWYFYNVGMSAIYSDPLTDYLYVGFPDGSVSIYDDYSRISTATLSASLTTPRLSGGSPFLLKLLQWVYIDVKLHADDTLTARLYVDDVERHTFTVTRRGRYRVPGALMGRDFKLRLEYTGIYESVIRGFEFIWLPMMSS